MARRTKKQEQEIKTHPYSSFEGTPLWRTIRAAVRDLITNQDLRLLTGEPYVIGYLTAQIAKHHGQDGTTGRKKKLRS